MRVAAIDVGSNSTRLLVADVDETGTVNPVCRKLATTRLGQGITGGRLLPTAMERTLDVIVAYAAVAEQAGVREVALAATSAVREAANQNEFVRAVHTTAGRSLQVLSGVEEARLSYLGVISGLRHVGKAVVVDIGGGSTEFIWRRDGNVRCASVNAGAVRMTEGGYGRGQIRAVISGVVQEIGQDGFEDVVGVGGTATTLAAMVLGLHSYDPCLVHGYRVDRDTVDALDRRLHELDLEDRKHMPGLQPERADIIPAGVRILRRVLQHLGASSLLVSEADILYGLVIEQAKVVGI